MDNTSFAPPSTTVTQEPKRGVATQLWVYFEFCANGINSQSDNRHLISFDYKSDLDDWLDQSDVRVITIIRGVEKKFVAQTRVTLT